MDLSTVVYCVNRGSAATVSDTCIQGSFPEKRNFVGTKQWELQDQQMQMGGGAISSAGAARIEAPRGVGVTASVPTPSHWGGFLDLEYR